MNSLFSIRDFVLNYLARQSNPEHTLDLWARWAGALFCIAVGVYLGHHRIIDNLRAARLRISRWWRLRRPRQRPPVRAVLLADPSLLKIPASHDHTVPPGEELDVPWCEPCKSYHSVPKTHKEWKTLQCKNDSYKFDAAVAEQPAPAGTVETLILNGQEIPASDIKIELNPQQPSDPAPGPSLQLFYMDTTLFSGGIEGSKIKHQPPREPEQVCIDPFCWKDHANCIHPKKVKWLHRHMDGTIRRILETSRN